MDDYPVFFTMITNVIYSNPKPHMVVLFFRFLYIEKKNVKRGRGKGERQKLRKKRIKLDATPNLLCY